ncbi:MAG: hypothetical protein WCB79_06005, partial [Halobacteriota archaeon]
RALSRIAPENAIISKRMLRLGIAALIGAVVLLVSGGYLEAAFAIPLNVALAAAREKDRELATTLKVVRKNSKYRVLRFNTKTDCRLRT